MNAKQRKFCELYAADPNATRAAAGAGYSEKTAYSIGQRLLKVVEIQNYLRDMAANAERERIADAAEVQAFLTATMRDASVKPSDRIRAGEILLKAQGGMIDQVKLDAQVETVKSDEFTVICVPWRGGPFNAVLVDGEVRRLADADDTDVLTYFDPLTQNLTDYDEGTGRFWVHEPDEEDE